MHVFIKRDEHQTDKRNVVTREFCATDKDIQTYIDICIMEHAENPKHKTLHLENFAIITVDSESITPQKK